MAVKAQLDRLAAFEPAPYPVVSLYLNTQPGQTGRDQFHAFVRKEFAARARTYPAGSPERESLDEDLERISRFLDTEIDPAANGVAVFACSAGELFEAVQISAPIDEHWLYIGDQPHLYPLARIESLHPACAVLLADTNAARIMVFAIGEVISQKDVTGVKTKRNSQGGAAQARYQRHVENFHLQHIKEVVDALDEIVQRENIAEIVVAGDEVVLPLLREQMPKHLRQKVVEHVRMNGNSPVDQLISSSLDALKRAHTEGEREKVDAAVGGFRAGGLGVVGPEDTLEALIKGQVDELLISSQLTSLQPVGARAASTAADTLETVLGEPALEPVAAGEPAGADAGMVRLADELVTRAKQTSAKITFIQNAALLAAYGGVAAILRFKI
jgi:peptide subunit release factor 1 (eRF1)